MKLPKPDLALALNIAQNLGFDVEMMSELLPVGIWAMNEGINEKK